MTATFTVLGAAGTSPTLDLALITAPVNTGIYYDETNPVISFAQATAAGTETKVAVDALSRFLRYKANVGGTDPVFNIEIDLICRC